MPVYEVQGPDGTIYDVEGPENADPSILIATVARHVEGASRPTSEDVQQQIAALKPEYGFGETISRGASRGLTRLGSTVFDVIPAMAASGLGFDDYAKEQLGEAAQTEQELARTNAPEFQSYKDVGGIGDALKFASQVGSEQLANLATAIVPGVGLGGLAARGAAGTAAQIAAKKAAGQMIGTYLGSYALNAPEVFQNVYQETGTLAPAASALFATASAALDSFLPTSLMRTVPAPLKAGIVERLLARSGMDKGLLRSVTSNVIKDTTGEAVTEAAQEGISIAAERFINAHPEAFGKEEWDRIMESAVQGGIGGGVFGIAGGAAERASAGAQDREKLAAIREQRAVRDAATRARNEDVAREAEIAEYQKAGAQGEAQLGLPGIEPIPYASSLVTPTPEVAEPKAQGKVPKTAEMFTPEGTLTPATEKMVSRDEKAAAIRARQEAQRQAAAQKEAAIRARQEAQRQAAAQKDAARVAKEQERKTAEARGAGIAEVAPKSVDLLANARPPLERVLGTDFTAKAQKDLDAAAAKQGKLQAARPAPATPATQQATPKFPTTKEERIAFAKEVGLNPSLAMVRKDNGILAQYAAQDLTDPAVAARLVEDLETKKKDFTGDYADRNAAAVDSIIAKFAPKKVESVKVTTPAPTPAPTSAPAPAPTFTQTRQPAPTTAPTPVQPAPKVEEPSGQAQTVETETQEREVGQKTSEAPAAVKSAAVSDTAGAPVAAPEKRTRKRSAVSAAKSSLSNEDEKILDAVGLTAEEVSEINKKVGAAYTDMFGRKKEEGAEGKPTVGAKTPRAGKGISLPKTDKATRAAIELLDTAAAEKAKALNADTAVPATVPESNKVASAEIADQIAAFIAKGGKITYGLVKALRSSQLEGKLLDAVTSGDLKKTITLLVAKMSGRPEAQQILRRVQNLGLKTKLVVGVVSDEGLALNEQWAAQEDYPSRVGREEALQRIYRRLSDIYDESYSPEEAYDTAMQELPPAEQSLLRALDRADMLGFDYPHQAIQAILEEPTAFEIPSQLKTAISRVGNREFYAPQRAGSYDPATDTITLDPELGLNEHTLIHEIAHAALVHVLANPELEVTKQFTKFFNEIKDRVGDAYGGQDLQEFAAELVSNPEFQALLKSIKAPRSESLWTRIMQAIAEFFGFRGRQSAYEAGLKFVSDALDVSGDQKVDLADSIFYGPGKLNELGAEVAAAARGSQERLRDALSNAKTMGIRRAILGAVSLNDMESLAGDKLPIRDVEVAVESKRGAIDQGIDRISKIVRELMRVENKHPEQVKRMNRMAIDARRAGVDLLNPQFKPTPGNQAEYTRLSGVYNGLPPEVRNAYRLMREDLDSSLKKFTTLLQSFVPPSTAQKLLQDFANMEGVIGYMPFMRYGEYWIEYTDPATEERTPMSFESDAAREKAISALKSKHPKLEIKSFMNIQNMKAPKDLPAASFISKTINEMRANNVSEDVVNEVYQQYYLMFPAGSIMKQFTKAKLLPGMNEDMIRAYSDVAVKWVNKLANTEYNPKIITALDRVKDAAGKEGKYSDDMNIQAVASSIEGQRESFLNLNYSPIARALTTGSYYLHILGSVASAIVNLTGLPFFVYPILGGRFGYGATMSTMTEAGSAAARGWGESWSKGKYKALYTSLDDRGLLQHTTAREALERSKTTGKELGGLTTKVIDLFSIPFNASERYMRATTAIAAYELARKGAPGQKPMSEAEAIEFAAKTVKDTHTAGMSEVSPEYFKNDFGRVILTFKKIGFQQATVIALAFHRAFLNSDLDPKVKDVARRQLLGIFGMSGAFLGAAGLPFYGAFSVLGRMLAALMSDDDDEPYDFNMQMRKISGEFYEGLIAKALNIELSKRAALASDILWRDDPISVQNYGYARTLLANLAGPMGNYVINAERAATEIARGNVERGVETLMPTFIANGMKGVRYMLEGAETLDGDPIESDISVVSGLTQMVGFAPADLADLQERRSAAKQYEAAVLARKQRILDGYNMARANGDSDMAREYTKQADAFRRKYPGLMDQDTLQRSFRAREAAQAEMMRGIRISKSLQADIEKRFKLGED